MESAYEEVLAYELKKNNLLCQRQAEIPVAYEKITMYLGCRADLVIEDKVIVEIKSVDKIEDVHRAQLLNYLRISGIRIGLLINFSKPKLEYERLIV